MALEEKLRARYKDELNSVDDVEELILDELLTIEKLTEKDKIFLERFKSLAFLSLNLLGLNSLDNLPNIPTLEIVSTCLTAHLT